MTILTRAASRRPAAVLAAVLTLGLVQAGSADPASAAPVAATDTLVFTADKNDDGHYGLYRREAGTTDDTVIVPELQGNGAFIEPVVAPKSGKIVFTRLIFDRNDALTRSILVVVNADGTGRKPLAELPRRIGLLGGASVHPGGGAVLFTVVVEEESALFRVPITGGRDPYLVARSGDLIGGQYDPRNGKRVVAHDLSRNQLVFFDTTTGRRTPISYTRGGELPVISPDGKYVAFRRVTSLSPFRVSLEVRQLGGDFRPKRLVAPQFPLDGPRWSADSRTLYFTKASELGSRYQDLYSVGVTGGAPVNLSDTAAVDEWWVTAG